MDRSTEGDLGVTTVTMRPSASSDQDSSDAIGLSVFQFIQDPRDYETRSVHSNQDTYGRLLPEDLNQASVVDAIFLLRFVQQSQMISPPRADDLQHWHQCHSIP